MIQTHRPLSLRIRVIRALVLSYIPKDSWVYDEIICIRIFLFPWSSISCIPINSWKCYFLDLCWVLISLLMSVMSTKVFKSHYLCSAWWDCHSRNIAWGLRQTRTCCKHQGHADVTSAVTPLNPDVNSGTYAGVNISL